MTQPFILGLAQQRGHSADWDERAVRQGASPTADDALRENAIDLVAGDLPELLARLAQPAAVIAGWLSRRAQGPFSKALPAMGDTERAALEADSVGFVGALFAGRPNYYRLLARPPNRLTREEQAFLDHKVPELVAMLDDFAHAAGVTRIATADVAAAVTVIVPNSIDRAERMDLLSARLGDALGHLYLAAASVWHFQSDAQPALLPFARAAIHLQLQQATATLRERYDNPPSRLLRAAASLRGRAAHHIGHAAQQLPRAAYVLPAIGQHRLVPDAVAVAIGRRRGRPPAPPAPAHATAATARRSRSYSSVPENTWPWMP